MRKYCRRKGDHQHWEDIEKSKWGSRWRSKITAKTYATRMHLIRRPTVPLSLPWAKKEKTLHLSPCLRIHRISIQFDKSLLEHRLVFHADRRKVECIAATPDVWLLSSLIRRNWTSRLFQRSRKTKDLCFLYSFLPRHLLQDWYVFIIYRQRQWDSNLIFERFQRYDDLCGSFSWGGKKRVHRAS